MSGGSIRKLGDTLRGDRAPTSLAVMYLRSAGGVAAPWDGSVLASLSSGMSQANGDYTRDGATEQAGTVLHGLGWGLDGVTWRPLPLQVPGDSQANPTTGILSVLAKLQYWAGSDWRRVYGIGNTGIAVGNTGAVNCAAYNFTWDGSAHQPLRSEGSQALVATLTDPSLSGTPPTSASMYTKGGTTVSANVKASAGRVLSVSARISHATAAGAWFQLFNKASAPAGGDACIWQMWVQVNTAQNLTVDAGRDHFGPQGFACSAGISWGISTTADTYTAIGAVVNGAVNISYR